MQCGGRRRVWLHEHDQQLGGRLRPLRSRHHLGTSQDGARSHRPRRRAARNLTVSSRAQNLVPFSPPSGLQVLGTCVNAQRTGSRRPHANLLQPFCNFLAPTLDESSSSRGGASSSPTRARMRAMSSTQRSRQVDGACHAARGRTSCPTRRARSMTWQGTSSPRPSPRAGGRGTDLLQ
jgi:hypothetical protein